MFMVGYDKCAVKLCQQGTPTPPSETSVNLEYVHIQHFLLSCPHHFTAFMVISYWSSIIPAYTLIQGTESKPKQHMIQI